MYKKAPRQCIIQGAKPREKLNYYLLTSFDCLILNHKIKQKKTKIPIPITSLISPGLRPSTKSMISKAISHSFSLIIKQPCRTASRAKTAMVIVKIFSITSHKAFSSLCSCDGTGDACRYVDKSMHIKRLDIAYKQAYIIVSLEKYENYIRFA